MSENFTPRGRKVWHVLEAKTHVRRLVYTAQDLEEAENWAASQSAYPGVTYVVEENYVFDPETSPS